MENLMNEENEPDHEVSSSVRGTCRLYYDTWGYCYTEKDEKA